MTTICLRNPSTHITTRRSKIRLFSHPPRKSSSINKDRRWSEIWRWKKRSRFGSRSSKIDKGCKRKAQIDIFKSKSISRPNTKLNRRAKSTRGEPRCWESTALSLKMIQLSKIKLGLPYKALNSSSKLPPSCLMEKAQQRRLLLRLLWPPNLKKLMPDSLSFTDHALWEVLPKNLNQRLPNRWLLPNLLNLKSKPNSSIGAMWENGPPEKILPCIDLGQSPPNPSILRNLLRQLRDKKSNSQWWHPRRAVLTRIMALVILLDPPEIRPKSLGIPHRFPPLKNQWQLPHSVHRSQEHQRKSLSSNLLLCALQEANLRQEQNRNNPRHLLVDNNHLRRALLVSKLPRLQPQQPRVLKLNKKMNIVLHLWKAWNVCSSIWTRQSSRRF